ncbi:MAG TPA: hypothetical protein ENN99_05380 [Chloroflexi bacterium]|nr:hypothetical protein [Chloroflexota bacterium]
MKILTIILSIYSWSIIGVLLLFLVRIAYFYEKTSGQKTSYRLLAVPILLLAGGVGWYLFHGGTFIGEPVGDLLLFGGGALLSAFGIRLQEFMTGGRQ